MSHSWVMRTSSSGRFTSSRFGWVPSGQVTRRTRTGCFVPGTGWRLESTFGLESTVRLCPPPRLASRAGEFFTIPSTSRPAGESTVSTVTVPFSVSISVRSTIRGMAFVSPSLIFSALENRGSHSFFAACTFRHCARPRSREVLASRA